jgi:hypothetical protein
MSRKELQLALEARICLNSARKALRKGPDALRGDAGVRASEVMERHGWTAQAPRATESEAPNA